MSNIRSRSQTLGKAWYNLKWAKGKTKREIYKGKARSNIIIALIDGDILVYECGFSSDANAKKMGLEHEPLSHCLQNVKVKIEEIMKVVGADDYEIYLTGKDNFRFKYLPDYKANRDEAHKPYWYKEIKEYLVEQYDAEIVDGMEADDILAIRQCTEEEDHTCICSKDKDLDMIPGFHYNWSPSKYERGVYEVSELEGMRFFYTQILTGDTTDNIPGLKRSINKVATAKRKAPIQEMTEEIDMYNHVKELYGDFDFHPIAHCLWMLRDYDKHWEAPSEMVEVLDKGE